MSNRPTTRRGLLVIGGAGPAPNVLAALARGAASIVAADAGFERCLAAGIVPDLVVGDMDSISDRRLLDSLPADRVLVFPADKDETDTELGLRIMRERGCPEVTIAGGGGGRLDHLLAIVGLFEREDPPVLWLTDDAEIVSLEGEMIFQGWTGATVTVLPLGEGSSEMHSEGLQWPLDGLRFRRGYGGVSNRAIADRVLIRVGQGRVLVIKSFPKER